MSRATVFQTPGKHSKLWKEWRRIGQGRSRRFFMEHRQAVTESLQGEHPPLQVLLSRELYSQDEHRWRALAGEGRADWFLVEQERLDQVVSVRGSGGLCGVYEPLEWEAEDLRERDFILLLWEVQDPGNLGTIIRTCGGLVGGAAVLLGGCNPWSAKVARASAGALFRVPLLTRHPGSGETLLRQLAEWGFRIFVGVPRGGEPPSRLQWGEKCAVILGNESHGVPELPDFVVPFSISTTSAVESLNVAVAAAVVCYERSR